jgi:hypothetical protein
MGSACVYIGEDEECTQNFGQETYLEVPTWKTEGWEDNVEHRVQIMTIPLDLCRTGKHNSSAYG